MLRGVATLEIWRLPAGTIQQGAFLAYQTRNLVGKMKTVIIAFGNSAAPKNADSSPKTLLSCRSSSSAKS
jgi:hypothetical protein